MANEYLYGIDGRLGDTIAQSAIQAGTVPVYVGTAPVNLVRDYAGKAVVNNPVEVTNMVSAQKTLGFSENWNSFGLCAAMAAHFDNVLGNIGPVYMINVLDPDTHRKDEPTTGDITFSNGQATIVSDTIILDTLVLDGLQEDKDYKVSYNFTSGKVVISSATDTKLSGTVSAEYYEVDITKVDADTVIGGVSADGDYTGIGAIQLIYPKFNAVSNLIAAPGWSQIPKVYNALIKAASHINGHWDAFVCADLPLKKTGGDAVDTIEKAIQWKEDNAYNNESSKVFWPMAKDNTGRIYPLSVLGMVELMRADYSHGSIPMETCGNKKIPVVSQYFGELSKNKGFDQDTAKALTKKGITTCAYWGGNWVLWGDHTAAYSFGADVDPRAIFDVSMRMLYYITISFQREHGTEIDGPFTRQLKDSIMIREQEKLDILAAKGALIGEPKILFLEANNSIEDMMNGDFSWDVMATPTPPFKSGTARVSYTDEGFKTYYE